MNRIVGFDPNRRDLLYGVGIRVDEAFAKLAADDEHAFRAKLYGLDLRRRRKRRRNGDAGVDTGQDEPPAGKFTRFTSSSRRFHAW
jgi:hypothetical protein